MRDLIDQTFVVAKREFRSYFATPLALIFLSVFVALSGAFAFYIGQFFDRGQADLTPFFAFHPWLFLFLAPALAMRLWAEERKTGTIELLMTLPISPWAAILGKFVAAWGVIAVALLATAPMWVTVNLLGSPDNGVIVTSYVGSLLVAGAFLAVGSCLSALTKNQVIAFILAAVACFILVMSGYELVLNAFRGWAPGPLIAAVESLSVISHFDEFTKGVFSLPALVFFVSLIVFALFTNRLLLDLKKAA